ncbi:MAG TPA: hypothetical protein VL092_04890 [Chitinophagaceae bacterium]|nr:hypothetical protein [Chitinophagaceae bacterium]
MSNRSKSRFLPFKCLGAVPGIAEKCYSQGEADKVCLRDASFSLNQWKVNPVLQVVDIQKLTAKLSARSTCPSEHAEQLSLNCLSVLCCLRPKTHK